MINITELAVVGCHALSGINVLINSHWDFAWTREDSVRNSSICVAWNDPRKGRLRRRPVECANEHICLWLLAHLAP